MANTRKPDLRVNRARTLRHNATDAERKLWRGLRRLPAVHFRRQATIGRYFADFACHTSRIVIEIDGGQHADSRSDAIRTAYLEGCGYRVLRFWNNEVLTSLDGVMQAIVATLNIPTKLSPPTPDPSPPQERGEGRSGAACSPPPASAASGGEGSGVGGRKSIANRSLSGGSD